MTGIRDHENPGIQNQVVHFDDPFGNFGFLPDPIKTTTGCQEI